MTKLSWGASGERLYETGVDRGVVYIEGAGFAWNGLISVSENSSGGDVTPYYVDGVQYAHTTAIEEFVGTIEAFFSPPEFEACDGTYEAVPGLIITKQFRKSFGLAYRSLLGNDVDGVDHGYKIHLIYNAYAGPSDLSRATVQSDVSPTSFSWPITAVPQQLPGYRPTAHFIVNSTRVGADKLAALEDILYGTNLTAPRFPEMLEVMSILAGATEFIVVDLGNGTATISGPETAIIVSGDNITLTGTSILVIDATTYSISSV